MTGYVWPLQCVGLLLTAALIGALVLVMEEKRTMTHLTLTPNVVLLIVSGRALFSHRPARCVKPASRDFHPHRHRDDARRGEPEFHRVLAFRLRNRIRQPG